ncbi:Uncharacterized protein cmbei_8003550 [Cryptosporidium meleagridis]
MIHSIWHLELVLCMYFAMPPYFNNMLMRHSLQNLIGSTIFSMKYIN